MPGRAASPGASPGCVSGLARSQIRACNIVTWQRGEVKQDRCGPPAPGGLSRDQVLDAALQIVESEGIDG